MTGTGRPRPAGLKAIDREMERQREDAIASFERNTETAARVAASLERTGRLLMLGMGASHAAGRAVEPLYRERGIDAIAVPLSEQLGQPLPLEGRTVLVTSQSGESAEVVRWFGEAGGMPPLMNFDPHSASLRSAPLPRSTGERKGAKPAAGISSTPRSGGNEQDRSVAPRDDAAPDVFGLTLEASSFLARTVPSLVGAGGGEIAFAATRSLTVSLALHLAVLAALGADPAAALTALREPQDPDIGPALAALAGVATIVTSGRRLQGLAEALALGLTELSRRPSFALEGGQFRHGPMEMLGPGVGVILFRQRDATAGLVGALAASVAEAGSPAVVFDCSGEAPEAGAVTIPFRPASGMAAVLAMLPAAQRLMVAFADARVADAGTPVRSTKITRSE
jgi:fructoselysine-6-P-deglycase FrlB-like protein